MFKEGNSFDCKRKQKVRQLLGVSTQFSYFFQAVLTQAQQFKASFSELPHRQNPLDKRYAAYVGTKAKNSH